jgi:hypothetical protein
MAAAAAAANAHSGGNSSFDGGGFFGGGGGRDGMGLLGPPSLEGGFLSNIMPKGDDGRSDILQHQPTSPMSDSSTSLGPKADSERLERDLLKEMESVVNWQNLFMEHSSSAMVDGIVFKSVITVLVILNAIVMGVELDYPEHELLWLVLNHLFATAWVLEMCLKLLALRMDYFKDYWNWLDFVLALLSIGDTWLTTILQAEGGRKLQKFTILRVLRLMRLARLMRLFRSLNRLVIVMQSIMEAIESTVWVTIVLACCIYVASIICVMFIRDEGENLYPGYAKEEKEIDDQEVMMNFNPYLSFGSIPKAMVTLLNVALMAEWAEVVNPVRVKQPAMMIFFMFFCVFVCFGVMQVIIGMIVNSVIVNAQALEKELEAARKKEKVTILAGLKKAIFSLDADGDHKVNLCELDRFLAGEDDESRALLSRLSLPYGFSADEFFCMLDNDGDASLDHSEFLTSLYRLINCGQASLNDLQKVKHC